MCQLKFAAKALSLILSVIMLLGVLPTSSFAIEPGDGTVDLEVSSTDIEGTYRYELVPSSENGGSDPVKGGYTGKLGNGYTITLGEDPVNVFDGISFTEKGTYSYKLVPILTGAGESGVVYDDSITDIKVSVTGDLHADVSPREIKFKNSGDNDSVDVGFSASVRLDGMDLTDDMFTFALSPVSITEIPSESNSGEKTEPVETPAPEKQENSEGSDDESEESDTTVSGGEESFAPEDENPESDTETDAETEAESKAEGETEAEGESKPGEVESSDTDTAGEDISSGTDTSKTGSDLLPEFPPVPDNDGVYFEDFGDEPHTFDGSEPVFTKSLSSGAVAFGTVTFTQPGIYTYEIYQAELPLDDEDWTYDSASYVVTVAVTRDSDDKLTAEVQYEKFSTDDDGDEVKEEADEVSFENFFTGVIVEPSPTTESEVTPEPETTEVPKVTPPGEEIVPGQQEESTPAPEGSGGEEGLPQESTSPEPTEEPTEPTATPDAAVSPEPSAAPAPGEEPEATLSPAPSVIVPVKPVDNMGVDENGKREESYPLNGETEAVETASLTVSMPELEDKEASFDFNYEFMYPDGMGEELPEPTGTFSLKSGESKVFEDLPKGTEYGITLVLPAGWSAPKNEWTGLMSGYDDYVMPQVYLTENEPPEETDFSLGDLAALDEHIAGAAVDYDGVSTISSDSVGGQYWSFSVYYVNGRYGRHDTRAVDDFSLKYQMEFHTSENIPERSVHIRIPISLLTFRDGSKCLPADIAVPEVASEEDSIESVNSPFNYYTQSDAEGEKLVFFNYKEITAGSNAAWQVVYNDVQVMDIVDETEWNLQATVDVAFKLENCAAYDQTGECDKGCVDPNGGEFLPEDHLHDRGEVDETNIKAEPLHGSVGTSASLLRLTKEPFAVTGHSYGPGLYTQIQVGSYVSGGLPAEFAGENFKNWKYVVWKVTARGSGTQPFDLWIKDTPASDGALECKVVGYKRAGGGVSLNVKSASFREGYSQDLRSDLNGYLSDTTLMKSRSWEQDFYVVTAYPSSVSPGTLVKNTIDMTLVPYDLKDEETHLSASARWNYADYNWHYEGDVIRPDKYVHSSSDSRSLLSWTHSTSMSGWLDVFKQASQTGKDIVPDFEFKAETTNRSYKLTHYTANVDQSKWGERIPGTATRVVTVDDAVYCYPNGTTANAGENGILLTSDDYYFSSVIIEEEDTGYDVWEDASGLVETATADDHIDQGMTIYAMFAKSRPSKTTYDGWEKVGHVDWPKDAAGKGGSVTLKYTFTKEQIAKEPYRVMVVHDTIAYNSFSTIYVNLHIRPTSKTMKAVLAKNPSTIQFENVCGVSGEFLQNGNPNTGVGTDAYFKGTLRPDGYYGYDNGQISGTYSEPGLKDFTNKLYGFLLMRDGAFATGKVIEKSAQTSKIGSLTNDPVSGRANVVYNITMYEGYLAGSSQIAQAVLDSGVKPPLRDDIVIYDLLPAGMSFDPSYPLQAGQLKSAGDFLHPSLWSQNVTAKYETVDLNYKNSGRTLMKFTLHRDSGGLKYSLGGPRIMQGWGLSFRGYWEWKNVGQSDLTENISAVMTTDNSKFFASEGNDGLCTDVSSSDKDFVYFGSDLDADGNTDDQRLAAKAMINEEIATASDSTINKTVRADSDKYSEFGKYAVADPGGGYTYEISVTGQSENLTDIVIFDRLENASVDRKDAPGETVDFQDTCWHGTFKSISVKALEEELKKKGGTLTVYYSTKRDAALPSGDQDPNEVLSLADWSKIPPSNLADVKAIAVSLGSYKLAPGDSISFRISMKAPSSIGNATWAYNNPSFYSLGTDTQTKATVAGNSVEVRIGEPKNLEIVKEYDEREWKVPEGRKTTQSFRIFVYDTNGDQKKPFSGHEYTLYTGSTLNGKYATDAQGMLTLKAGQKAVFEKIPDPSRITVEEGFDPFWDPSVVIEDGSSYVVKVLNKPKSVLFVEKKTKGGTPDDSDVFNFKLTADGKPAANVPYWLVDHAYTDGRLPNKVGSENASGKTGDDGTFTLKSGQIACIIGAADFGKTYKVEEVETGEDWIVEDKDRVREGKLDIMGNAETFINYYRWKNLYLTKSIQDRTTSGAETEDFTFKLELVIDGGVTPVKDIKWSQESGASGTTDGNGLFTCHAAAGVVTLEHLEARKKYTITEVNHPKFYAVVNEGMEEVTMPLYSEFEEATITNAWLRRPLEVTKVVLYDFDDDSTEGKQAAAAAKAAVFEMTVKCDYEGNGNVVPLANYAFRLLENGQPVMPGSASDPYGNSNREFKTDAAGKFKIRGSQTAIFDDAGVNGSKFIVTETQKDGYPQLVPYTESPVIGQDGAPVSGMMTNDGSFAKIVNGLAGSLVIRKEWKGLNDGGKAFVEAGKSGTDEAQRDLDMWPSIRMKVWGEDGVKKDWPLTDTGVTLVYDNGDIVSSTWAAYSAYQLKPWTQLVITGTDLTGYTNYEITEENGRRIQSWGEKHIAIDQETPEYGSPASGTIDKDPSVTMVNTAEEIGEKSRIAKRFVNEDTVVPKGARLVLVVEEYDGTYWNPAGDVPYVLCKDEMTYESDSVQYTGNNGKITLTSDGDGKVKWILFPEDKVYALDVRPPVEGAMRIRELLTESDAAWGRLVGLGKFDDDTSYTMDPTEMDRSGDTVLEAFVNVVDDVPIQVEKTVQHETAEKFTFTLKRITEVDGEVYARDKGITESNYNEAITQTIPGAEIRYEIYDSDTGRLTGDGVTDEYGHFTLHGGEYAEFNVPERTLWTVSEDITPGFSLKALNEKYGGDKTTKLADNLILFGADNDYKKGPDYVQVKYAVCIYGIGQDKDADGNVLVTFGPATGGDYTKTKKAAHAADKTCIHNMTWTEIMSKANNDPKSLMTCMKNGCTVSVDMTIFGPLKGEKVDLMETGDGASVLFKSINEAYRNWNATGSNTDGWSASRIRTTLNGTVSGTDGSVAGDKLLTEEQALISAFPLELREKLVAKAVKSGSNTTYDKLWLFSRKELYASGASVNANEGVSFNKLPGKSVADDGSGHDWWLRSVPEGSNAYFVDSTGSSGSATVTEGKGLAPGFCIGMKQPVYTVKVNPDGGELTLDAASQAFFTNEGGIYRRDSVKEGTEITLPTNQPKKTGFNFKGYALQDASGAALNNTTYQPDQNVVINMSLCANGPTPDTVVFKAKWEKIVDVYYAVAIYGIKQDDIQGGGKAALTFGPATGGNYTGNGTATESNGKYYKACEGTSADNPGNCLHWMTWSQIIEKAKTNPESFRNCLENGCTHSIALSFGDSPLMGRKQYPNMSGDGASAMCDSINSDYSVWNMMSDSSFGWRASRIRTTLNGKENCNDTDTSIAGTDLLNADQALISAFPQELQEAIVPKAVVSDTGIVPAQPGADTRATTYDKLWLFSLSEISSEWDTNDGSLYQRSGTNKTTRMAYKESGGVSGWWTRSISHSEEGCAYGIAYDGTRFDASTSMTNCGIAPGFCLGKAQ